MCIFKYIFGALSLFFFLILFLTFSNWKMFKHRNKAPSSLLWSSHRQKELPVSCWWEQPSRKLMAGSFQTLWIMNRVAVQRGQNQEHFCKVLPNVHMQFPRCQTLKVLLVDEEKGDRCRSIKGNTGKQPFLLPFLHFCGLTIPKHSCCPSCQEVCAVCRIPNATTSRLKKQVLLKDATCHLRSSACWNV